MNDDNSDWISLDEAATYVETTINCYRNKAIDLLHQRADNLKLKSRTVKSSPMWVGSVIGGQEVFHSDYGERIEVSREGVHELCAELQKAAESTPSRIGSGAVSDGIRLAIDDIWPGGIPKGVRAKHRNAQILEWLKNHKKSISAAPEKAIQRVLKRGRKNS